MARKSLFVLTVACLLTLGGCIGDGGSMDGDGDSPADDLTFSVPRAFPNLTFDLPVAMLQAPGDDTRWFVVEQDGVVRTFENDDAVATSTQFINIASRVRSPDDGGGTEAGLLGMAFHPSFPEDPRVYLYYTTLVTGSLFSRISEFRTADDGETLDPASEVVLISVPQPESNHKGGNLAFGSDDLLFIGLGDGGGAGDQHGDSGNGQDTQTLLGKILRIDVGAPDDDYAIPADNPFAGNDLCTQGTGTDPCPEIYAYGFRNPWRWSFDRTTGDLWVGDVGQDSWEEIDKVEPGGNYGWRCREGSHDFNLDCGDADLDDLIDPVVEYGRQAGFSVTGGYVYRGTAIPDLVGRYVFGDYGGRLFQIATDTEPTEELTASDGFDTGLQIVSFAEDADGELYIVDIGGTLHRLEAD